MADGGRRYLARSWLLDRDDAGTGTPRPKSKVASWSGDWYVNFGDAASRSWQDGLRYSFVSAGGGERYSGKLRQLQVGSRIYVYVPGSGYVATGQTTRVAVPFSQATVLTDRGQVRLEDQELHARYRHDDRPGEDTEEYVVAVKWDVAVPLDNALRFDGMFANPNTVCKLRQEFTLEKLRAHFGIDA